MIDGEVEGDDGVAAHGVQGVEGGGGGAGGVGRAVPRVGVAGSDGFHKFGRMVDGEVQGIDLGAVVGIKVRVSVVSGLSVNLTVPGIGVAGGVSHSSMSRVEDGKVEDDERVAADSVGFNNRVDSAFVVGAAIPYKRIAFCREGLHSFRDGEDGEVQGVHLSASKFVRFGIGICGGTAFGVYCTMPIIEAAGGDGVGSARRGAEGEVKDDQ